MGRGERGSAGGTARKIFNAEAQRRRGAEGLNFIVCLGLRAFAPLRLCVEFPLNGAARAHRFSSGGTRNLFRRGLAIRAQRARRAVPYLGSSPRPSVETCGRGRPRSGIKKIRPASWWSRAGL